VQDTALTSQGLTCHSFNLTGSDLIGSDLLISKPPQSCKKAQKQQELTCQPGHKASRGC